MLQSSLNLLNIRFQKQKFHMLKIISLTSLYLLISCSGNNRIEGSANTVLGTENDVKGNNNFQLSHNLDVTGSNNMLVGANYKTNGDNIKMFGPSTNINQIDGQKLYNDIQLPNSRTTKPKFSQDLNQDKLRNQFFTNDKGSFMKNINKFEQDVANQFAEENKLVRAKIQQKQVKKLNQNVNQYKKIKDQKEQKLNLPNQPAKKIQPIVKQKQCIKIVDVKTQKCGQKQIQVNQQQLIVLIPQKKTIQIKAVKQFVQIQNKKDLQPPKNPIELQIKQQAIITPCKKDNVIANSTKNPEQPVITKKIQEKKEVQINQNKNQIPNYQQLKQLKQEIFKKDQNKKVPLPQNVTVHQKLTVPEKIIVPEKIKVVQKLQTKIPQKENKEKDIEIVLAPNSGKQRKIIIHKQSYSVQSKQYKRNKSRRYKSQKKHNLRRNYGQCNCQCTKYHRCRNCNCCK